MLLPCLLSCVHIIRVCNLPLLVANNGELERAAADLVDVLDPSTVALDRVCRKTDQFDPPLCELGLELCESAQFSRADWGIILRVREEDDPIVADELMEVNRPAGGLSLEVGSSAAKAERLRSLVLRHLEGVYATRGS